MQEHDYYLNKRIWITGASKGIGKALAIYLSRFKVQLAISARNQTDLEEVRQLCDSASKIITIPADVGLQEDNNNAASVIKQAFGGVDIIILNAGTAEYVDIDSFNSELFDRVMRINFMSIVFGIEAFLSLLRQSQQPHIVGMSSVAAYGGLPRSEAYGASKAAARNMLAALRISLSPESIAVSTICPGFVKTPLTDKNDFPMPCLVEVDEAARRIAGGIAKQTEEIHFPKRFSLVMKLLTSLPSSLYTRLVKKMVLRK